MSHEIVVAFVRTEKRLRSFGVLTVVQSVREGRAFPGTNKALCQKYRGCTVTPHFSNQWDARD
jgi:hypothetical protein